MEFDLFRAEAGWGIAELKLIAPRVCTTISICSRMVLPTNYDATYLSRTAHAEESGVSLRHVDASSEQ